MISDNGFGSQSDGGDRRRFAADSQVRQREPQDGGGEGPKIRSQTGGTFGSVKSRIRKTPSGPDVSDGIGTFKGQSEVLIQGDL